jgi:GT2 family glycosyltransferase
MLDALRRQTLDAERFDVVLVDDGSTAEVGQVLAREQERDGLRLQLIRRARSGGPAVARNIGWRAAEGRLIAFTDDDCEPHPGWLEAILSAAERAPGAAIQGRTEPIPREAGAVGPLSRTLRITELGPYFQTCNMAYPRPVLEEVGGFDESYGFWGEDADLGWRAKEAGIAIVFAEDALVHHAVNEFGPLEKLRWALGWSRAMQALADHPALRQHLRWGIVWKESHAWLLLALLGIVIGRRTRIGYLLTIPYLRELRARSGRSGSWPAVATYLAAYDAVETFATIRGAVRYRAPVL